MPRKGQKVRRHPSPRQIAAYIVQEFLFRAVMCNMRTAARMLYLARGGIETRIGEEKWAEVEKHLHHFINDAMAHALKAWNDFLDPPRQGMDHGTKNLIPNRGGPCPTSSPNTDPNTPTLTHP